MARAPHTQRRSRETERQVGSTGFGSETQPIPVTPSHYLSHDAKRSVSLFSGSNQISETEFWGSRKGELSCFARQRGTQ